MKKRDGNVTRDIHSSMNLQTSIQKYRLSVSELKAISIIEGQD
jgi:hypothetical protein